MGRNPPNQLPISGLPMPNSTPAASTSVSIGRADEVTAAYQAELDRLPLAANTRRAYRTRVANFLAWLAGADLDGGDPLADPHARDYAVRDYARHLRVVGKKEPATVNAVLAALDHFYRWRGLGPPNARRQDLPQLAPRALESARGEHRNEESRQRPAAGPLSRWGSAAPAPAGSEPRRPRPRPGAARR
jgi:hypothetical protein